MNNLKFVVVPLMLVAFLFGCSTSIKCEGYPKVVCEKCGENPVEVRILKRMEATDMTDLAKKKSNRCINSIIKAKIDDAEKVDFSLSGCLSKEVELDTKSRDTLIKIVDDAINDKSLEPAFSAWQSCYRKYTIGT